MQACHCYIVSWETCYSTLCTGGATSTWKLQVTGKKSQPQGPKHMRVHANPHSHSTNTNWATSWIQEMPQECQGPRLQGPANM